MFEVVLLPNGDMRVPARAVSDDGETIGDGTKVLKKGTPEWQEWYDWWSGRRGGSNACRGLADGPDAKSQAAPEAPDRRAEGGPGGEGEGPPRRGSREEGIMTQTDPTPVPPKLLDGDGNALVILGRFQREARRVGWSPEQIKAVIDDATSGDYGHLLDVMVANTEDDSEDEDEDEEAAERREEDEAS